MARSLTSLVVLYCLLGCGCSDEQGGADSEGRDASVGGDHENGGDGDERAGDGDAADAAGVEDAALDSGSGMMSDQDAGDADLPEADDAATTDAGDDASFCSTVDCLGVCNGSATTDCLGVCNGSATTDCLGLCNGNATTDCLGVCNGSAQLDCEGTCGGTAECTFVVIVSEVMWNPVTVDDSAGEWFELYNPGTEPADLNGCTIADNAATVTIDTALVIAPGAYATFARGSSPGFTPTFNYGVNTLQLSNAADRIVVTCDGAEIERFEYTSTAYASSPGASLSISRSSLTVADHAKPERWCSVESSYNGDFGTPGAANPSCTAPAPAAGDLVITEIMANPATLADDVGEWFEVYNTRNVALDLGACLLRDDDTDSYAIPAETLIAPRGFTTFARNANPGFTPTYTYPQAEIALANTADELVIECDGTVIDKVTYGTPVSGSSLSLDPDLIDATANDASNAWCAGVGSYNGDLGTPNQANPQCP